MQLTLTPIEARILGALIEKEITTPEYYPLSLNALTNACNQKSNRDPAMHLEESEIRKTLNRLEYQSLVRSVSSSDSRVTKFEHRLQDAFNFYRPEIAILCELLLRGPQTPGELRTRTDRLYPFDDIEAVHSALRLLMNREPPVVKVLARQPGTKESRYAHLLSGDVQESTAPSVQIGVFPDLVKPPFSSTDSQRLAQLEEEVTALRSELADLKQQLALFQKQFQ